MDSGSDPVLTGWAADCAAHALAQFSGRTAEHRALDAIAAARAWTAGQADAEACRDAAVEAQFAAREMQDDGYRAIATVLRAAGFAAASVDDTALAVHAAAMAAEALELNSAPCEQQHAVQAERRWQWEVLPSEYHEQIFPVEPPQPAAASCALPEATITARPAQPSELPER